MFYRFGCSLIVSLAAAAVVCVVALAEPPSTQPGKTESPALPPAAAKTEPKGDPYPLDTCIVSGEKLGSMGKPVVKGIDGREIRFCCKGCVGLLEKDKATYMRKLDDAIIERQLPHYPLKTCVVMTDETLETEDAGSPVNHVYKNRLVRFCCRNCIKDFNADPAKYLARLDEAVIKQQKPIYPLDACPMTGEKLGEDAVDKVVGVTLIRFCCGRCAANFTVDPQPALVKVREAWAAKHKNEKGPHGHQ